MMYEWKIVVRDAMNRFGKEIWIHRKNTENRIEVLKPDGRFQVADQGAIDLEPTMYLDNELYQMLVKEMVRDYVPPEKHYLEGKSQVQEKYIADLRHLLKLPKEI